MLRAANSKKEVKMTALDIGEIIFIVIVLALGFGLFIKVLLDENKEK